MILTNFALPDCAMSEWRQGLVIGSPNRQPLKTCPFILRNRRKIEAILNANPSIFSVLLLATFKYIFLRNTPTVLFDLILKNPVGITENIIAKFKGIFLRKFDHIIAIHKDTSGYEKKYGLEPRQFIYIPFKANNFDTANESTIIDGDYLVALGASQRDYPTFLKAVKDINLKSIIVCSNAGAIANNANVGDVSQYPANTTRITHHVPTDEWYRWIAQSKFVVVPIKDCAIQPAGISVYLESIRLRKATIVSAGASANGILEHGKTALVVPAADSAALHSAIKQLIDDPELRQQIATNGYAYAMHLRNDQRLRKDIAETIIKIIETRR